MKGKSNDSNADKSWFKKFSYSELVKASKIPSMNQKKGKIFQK